MEIQRIIEQIDTLKPVSTTSERIMEIACRDDSSLSELVNVIKYDQSMTANLLRICNSSYFGLKTKIISVQQAVAYLGVKKVALLAIMSTSSGNFKKAQSGYDLNEGELWRYSVSSAIIAQNLSEKLLPAKMPLLFTAALLKDVGKVILNDFVKDAFKDILDTVQNDNLTFIDAERKVLGIDHAELGTKVAEKWHLNPEMVQIIRHHHRPEAAQADDMSIPIVYLADSICMMIGIGGGSDGLSYRHDQNVMDRLNFSAVNLQKVIADFWGELNDVEELIKFS